MTEIASNKHNEESTKSAELDEKDKITNEMRIDEKELPSISAANKNNELNDVHQEEKKILASNVTDENLVIKKTDVDDTRKEVTYDPTSPTIPEDNIKMDEKQNTEQKTEQEVRKICVQEILVTPLHSQNVDEEKDTHNEDGKDSLKETPVLKRKRKNLR